MSVFLHDLGSTSSTSSRVSIPVAGPIPVGSLICVGVSLYTSGVVTGTPSVTDNSGNTYKLAASKLLQSSAQNAPSLWAGFFYAPNCKGVNPNTQITFDFNPTNTSASVVMSAGWASGIVALVDPLSTVKMNSGNTVSKTTVTVSSIVSLTPGDLMWGFLGMSPWDINVQAAYNEDTSLRWASPPFQRWYSYDGKIGLSGPTVINPNGTGIVTWTPRIPTSDFWIAIMCGFKVAETTNLSAVGYDVGRPEIGPTGFSVYGNSVPRGITVGSPFIEAPSTNISNPQVVCLTHRDDGIMESLFTNVNVDFTLETDSNSIVGRTDPGRGQVQRVTVQYPLVMGSGAITLDSTGAMGDIPNRVVVLETQIQQMVLQSAVFTQALVDIRNQIADLQRAVSQLQSAVNVSNIYILRQPITTASPTIGKPTLG